MAFKSQIAQALRKKVWPLLESGKVKPVIHSTFVVTGGAQQGDSAAAQAHRLMESSRHIGKIVLEVGAP